MPAISGASIAPSIDIPFTRLLFPPQNIRAISPAADKPAQRLTKVRTVRADASTMASANRDANQVYLSARPGSIYPGSWPR